MGNTSSIAMWVAFWSKSEEFCKLRVMTNWALHCLPAVSPATSNFMHWIKSVHPWKLTAGNQSHGSLVQMIFLFNWVNFRFHVKFQGCRWLQRKEPWTLCFSIQNSSKLVLKVSYTVNTKHHAHIFFLVPHHIFSVFSKFAFEPRRKTWPYFPWSTGCLIGILISWFIIIST